ncbi:hypothetical protein ACTK75_004782, partial [Escherichia coli]|nr:hypothetical protein [Escherichia coli]EFK3807885.1 hypothetical protein [Escherichia coli]EJA9083017.1 hypothetical protein [Escherichia coli]
MKAPDKLILYYQKIKCKNQQLHESLSLLKSNTLSPLTFPESGNTKPRLVPTNGVFTFIHLRFASSQDFVLSARVAIPYFSAKYSAYLS